MSGRDNYQPPSGPPPGYHPPPQNQQSYQPPSGPPPSHTRQTNAYGNNQYAPPPGPPPSHNQQQQQQQQQQQAPPSYIQHDWQSFTPDTSLLPPPPSLGYEESPTANADSDQGERGYLWCKARPLLLPQQLSPYQLEDVEKGLFTLVKSSEYIGDLFPTSSSFPFHVGPTAATASSSQSSSSGITSSWRSKGLFKPQKKHDAEIRLPPSGHYTLRTHASCPDTCLIPTLPVYSTLGHSPLRTERPKTIYFEAKLLSLGRKGMFSRHGAPRSLEEADAGLAIGFVAQPYPTFRLPGWQRGSLAVHGDDGRRYVNDTFGGSDFTKPFAIGETVGIGMRFAVPKEPPAYDESGRAGKLDVEVFFTRNGMKEAGWDGGEELDARSEGGTEGLMGDCDLFPAVGVFGGVDFEVVFEEEGWLYKPSL